MTVAKHGLQSRDISLTYYDKGLLASGEKLLDKHINFALRILKMMFPKINGLRLTLLQDKAHKDPADNALQIFHVGGDHWICATTIDTPGKRVSVYDSSYAKWDVSALSLLKKQFRCSAEGKDPLKLSYNEALMHEHCFSNRKLELFP